jgi:uncharacterized protein
MDSVEFLSGNQIINGNVFYPKKLKEKNPAVLFIHGWTSGQDRNFPYAEKICELGYVCMTFDLRGHGISEGKLETLTTEDFLNDVISAYDYLVEFKNIDKENIIVVGSSFGSYLGAILTSKRKISNLVLRVPAYIPDEGFDLPQINFAKKPEIVEWQSKVLLPDALLPLRSIRNFKGNILIVESENDTLIPHQTILNYINAVINKTKLTYILMKGANHSISRDPIKVKEYCVILRKWFKDIVS